MDVKPEQKAPRILLAGGGTGGHLYPALAIAEAIKAIEPKAEFLFVGTRGKIEERVVPAEGYHLETIWISGFARSVEPENLAFPLKVIVSLFQSSGILNWFRPDVVVGTGGYVCGPVVAAAFMKKIPVVLHESNNFPGVTTRLLASRATKVFVSFEQTKKWLKRQDNIEVSGTPTRSSLGRTSIVEASKHFALKSDRRTVLIFGGSLGSASINKAVSFIITDVRFSTIQFIWQTGPKEFLRYADVAGARSNVWVGPYIENIGEAYAMSDLVLCRAGAITLAELTRLGKPAILVPYPKAAEDHQTANAKILHEAGAGVMVKDSELEERLPTILLDLLEDFHKLDAMGKACRALSREHVSAKIAQYILQLCHRK
jgi:UDP-N-acetylglucosamine--N-acetylmuramyl-(pentapeptide) pyrophosphoryl-undecaprenol N-acetylglucosamine transferase